MLGFVALNPTYGYPGTNCLKTLVGTHAELFSYDDDGNTTQRISSAAIPAPSVTDPSDYIYNTNGQRT